MLIRSREHDGRTDELCVWILTEVQRNEMNIWAAVEERSKFIAKWNYMDFLICYLFNDVVSSAWVML
jgi:hypothetical protein